MQPIYFLVEQNSINYRIKQRAIKKQNVTNPVQPAANVLLISALPSLLYLFWLEAAAPCCSRFRLRSRCAVAAAVAVVAHYSPIILTINTIKRDSLTMMYQHYQVLLRNVANQNSCSHGYL